MTQYARRSAGLFSACIALLLAVGCAKSEEDTPRFNEVLGGSLRGAPVSHRGVDAGILEDATAYKPTIAPKPSGTSSAAGGGLSADTEAARSLVRNTVEGLAHAQLETLLDVFVPEQIEALRKDPFDSKAHELFASIEQLTRIQRAKLGGGESAAAQEEIILQELVSALADAASIEASGDAGLLRLDQARLATSLPPILAKAAALAGPLGLMQPPGMMPPGAVPPGGIPAEGGGDAGTPGVAPSAGGLPAGGPEGVPVRKVGDGWRIDIHHVITQEQADVLADVADFAKTQINKLAESLDSAETVDAAAYQQMLQGIFMSAMPEAMGLFARLQMAFAPADGAEKPEKQPDAPPEDSPQPSGEFGGRRRAP